MSSPHLAYYYFDSCPFCMMVQRTIEKLGVEVEYCDIYSDQTHLNKLIEDTGRRTVPCMYIDGTPMFESYDIIAWLETNISTLKKKA